MSRTVFSEHRLTGTLVVRSATSVGGGPPGVVDDLDVVRDGRGRLVVPGTALAGVLRAALGVDATGADPGLARLWGPRATGAEGAASQLWVGDAVAEHDPGVERRDGVAIDRRSGAAAGGYLYSREVVPPGTRFSVEVRVEQLGEDDESAARLLARVHDLLVEGVSVGSGTSAGRGLLRLEGGERGWYDLSSAAGMVARLRGQASSASEQEYVSGPARCTLSISVPWWACGPLLVGMRSAGVVSALPLVTTEAGRWTKRERKRGLPADHASSVRFVIPGTSLKGVLRSHAERIVRTMRDLYDSPSDLLEQVADSAPHPVGALFGLPPRRDRTTLGSRGSRAAVTVAECTSRTSLPAAQWRDDVRVLTASPDEGGAGDRNAELRAARTAAERYVRTTGTSRAAAQESQGAGDAPLRHVVRDHVALDRWTSAAADARLFTVLEADTARDRSAWEPLSLTVDVDRLGASAEAAVCLLALVLRDFCEGRVPIGSGTTRGMGEVRGDAQEARFTVAGAAHGWLQALDGAPLGDLLSGAGALESIRERLQGAWREELLRPPGTESTSEGNVRG